MVIVLPPLPAGLWTLPPAIASMIGCLVVPLLARHVPATAIVAAALSITTLSLAILTVPSGFAAVIAGMVGLGLGVAILGSIGLAWGEDSYRLLNGPAIQPTRPPHGAKSGTSPCEGRKPK